MKRLLCQKDKHMIKMVLLNDVICGRSNLFAKINITKITLLRFSLQINKSGKKISHCCCFDSCVLKCAIVWDRDSERVSERLLLNQLR